MIIGLFILEAGWAVSLPVGEEGLVDVTAGKPVRWVDGQGWIEESEWTSLA